MTECVMCKRNCPPPRGPEAFSRRHWTSKPLEDYRVAKDEKLNDQYALALKNERDRAKRSPTQQLAMLDKRLGKGKGAKKERARLLAQIETKSKKKSV